MRKLEERVDEGWMVHIYGRNRRLLCALEPSHGWSFLLGVGAGLILTTILVNVYPRSSPQSTIPSAQPAESPALQVD